MDLRLEEAIAPLLRSTGGAFLSPEVEAAVRANDWDCFVGHIILKRRRLPAQVLRQLSEGLGPHLHPDLAALLKEATDRPGTGSLRCCCPGTIPLMVANYRGRAIALRVGYLI
jgi:hypothetical protein